MDDDKTQYDSSNLTFFFFSSNQFIVNYELQEFFLKQKHLLRAINLTISITRIIYNNTCFRYLNKFC